MTPTLIIPILMGAGGVSVAIWRLRRWHREDREPREIAEALVEAGGGLMAAWMFSTTSLYVQLVITIPLAAITPLALREAKRRKVLKEAEEAKRLAAGDPPE